MSSLSLQFDLGKIGKFTHGPLNIEVVDQVEDYINLLKGIFDFDKIKAYLHGPAKPTVLFDALSGVTGPYGKAIFIDLLGLGEDSVQNCDPKPDFGGHHPDPNLTYAHELVEVVEKKNIVFGAASDGDGDRNMIYGAGAFVTPSDSVAIIADWAEKAIPYFSKANGGIKGLARSMPTSGAIDLVAKEKGFEVFEVPTGECTAGLKRVGRTCADSSTRCRLEVLWQLDGRWTSFHLRRRVVRNWFRPHPREGRSLGRCW
jgi:phosphoglucomutase